MHDHYIENIIDNYERDIMGNTYTFYLSDGTIIPLKIKPIDVPHLLGMRKLPLRQTQNKSASAVYKMLKNGIITLKTIAPYKESYKKVMNFERLILILHCGVAVKVVKRVGTLNSAYLLYLDHQPNEIVHLGVSYDSTNCIWYPESLLINLKRNVTKYIDGQLPIAIEKVDIQYGSD